MTERCETTKRAISVARYAAVAPLLLALAGLASGQMQLTLQQAGSRSGPDFSPAFEGRNVSVEGQVSSKALWISDSCYLPVQDAASHGLMLTAPCAELESFAAGDSIEAAGTIENRAGMPLLVARDVRRISSGPPPRPKFLRVPELAAFQLLGTLVTTESTVERVAETSDVDLVSIGEQGSFVTIFLPKSKRDAAAFSRLKAGDHIRVTGIAAQNCPRPPYNRSYQIWTPGAASVTLVEKAWLIPPSLLLSALISIAGVLGIWWIRERRMAFQRRGMRILNSLGEEVIASNSPVDILRKLSATLPKLAKDISVGLYLYNRGTKTLEKIQSATEADTSFVKLDSPTGPLASGLALCFRNRTLIAIPDTRRSPFFKDEDRPGWPRSLLFVPMFAQSELLGVLQLEYLDRLYYFSQEEQASMQHLANQAATALKLQEQQSIREQLFRSEKLAAAGQLISGVANELRSPLESIMSLASALMSRHHVEGFQQDLQMIGAEARRAAEIVSRLVSFAKIEQAEAQPVDVNGLLASLLEFRARELKQKGIEVRQQLSSRPLLVLGSQGQLEQVLLNLLVDAEQAAAEAKEKVLTITSGQLARRLLIEIVYQTRLSDFQKPDPLEGDFNDSGALGLSVCRGIIQSHGGDFRSIRASQMQARLEIELPVLEDHYMTATGNSAGRGKPRTLTVLVVEPDKRMQRQLVNMLGNRGDRVVPVSSAEEGADLAQRIRFDMAVCAARLTSWNWIEFFERVRHQVGGFVLLTDGFDADLARVFQGGEGFVLPKPVDEADLHRICHIVEERGAVRV